MPTSFRKFQQTLTLVGMVAIVVLGCAQAPAPSNLPADFFDEIDDLIVRRFLNAPEAFVFENADAGPAPCCCPRYRDAEVTIIDNAIDTAVPFDPHHAQPIDTDYLPFLERADAAGDGWAEADVRDCLADALELPGPNGFLPPDQLTATLIEGLGIGRLLAEQAAQPLTVFTEAKVVTDDVVEHYLLFEDDLLGRTRAVLRLPRLANPVAVVVTLPGHGDDIRQFPEVYLGSVLNDRGLATLTPYFRAMDGQPWEHDNTAALLERGFTMIGLQVYETLNLLKYLQTANPAATCRVGLLGHSAGSAIAALVARVEPDIAALAVDMPGRFSGLDPNGRFMHDIAPDLVPFEDAVNDFTTTVPPVFLGPYQYLDRQTEVADFLARHTAP